MDFVINIFWAILAIAGVLLGLALLSGLVGVFFWLFYTFIWKNTFEKLDLFQTKNTKDSEDESDTPVNVCLACALLTNIVWAVSDGSFQSIIEEIKNIFA